MDFNHGLENTAYQRPHEPSLRVSWLKRLSPPPVHFTALDSYTGPNVPFMKIRSELGAILQCQCALTWVISLSSSWFFFLPGSVSGTTRSSF